MPFGILSSHFVDIAIFSQTTESWLKFNNISRVDECIQQCKSHCILSILADEVQRVFFSYLLRMLKLQFVIKILTLSKSIDTFSLRLLKKKAACLVFFRCKRTTFVTVMSEIFLIRALLSIPHILFLPLVRKVTTSLLSVMYFHWFIDQLARPSGQLDFNMARDPTFFYFNAQL